MALKNKTNKRSFFGPTQTSTMKIKHVRIVLLQSYPMKNSKIYKITEN